MSEPRKNHLSIDGGQVKEDEHVASYKPIPESDTEFRTSKTNLSKSKEKISPDGAEEKLLPKEEEAKIVTRVDMADAKYVVEDHRNGDAKIELDANKRQFTGLTKEELLKYAEDPFWVNLRWAMFILFWALWLCMLAGAITIIVRAPKCAPPEPKTWFEKGPLIDAEESAQYAALEADLPLMQNYKVQGIFMPVPTYDIEAEPTARESFEAFVKKAKEFGIKVIVDLIPNYVSIDHRWFQLSKNNTEGYDNYFVWQQGTNFDVDANKRLPPNNWVSTLNTSAWTYNEDRKAHYLHQYEESQADLNFNNEEVVKEFDNVLKAWMKAGAAGVRLNKVRTVVVNATLKDEVPQSGHGSDPAADHTYYTYWRHTQTSDQPKLRELLDRWSNIVDQASENPGTGSSVFTIKEEGDRVELYKLLRNVTSLRPRHAAPVHVGDDVTAAAENIQAKLGKWPALQLKTSPEAAPELVPFALLLPAAPVLNLKQIESDDNQTVTAEALSHLVSLREDASIQHGDYAVSGVPARNSSLNTLLAVARWKAGHTGYLALFNPSAEEQRGNLTLLTSVPAALTPHYMSHGVRLYTNYSNHNAEPADNLLVPAKSSVIFSYVPRTSSEN
ncbi:uncharacterized protein LOC124640051 [Helicoverpa zea]|uniref:uncharacterized protein LOC124640051 n=1 Tax=Helicoverpa zea TaxID=7113 RepID=UPI001F59C79C|nr:uncharacterized protein LOC124640051 [Helicoverpa zea]